jgi:hypothetical protein
MIHVQKHFPPERLRYMRKVMKDCVPNLGTIAEGQPPRKLKSGTKTSISCVPESNSLGQTKAGSTPAVSTTPFDRWKLSQERQQWIFWVLIGAGFVLIIYTICR